MTKRAPLKVDETPILVTLPSGKRFQVPPIILHTFSHRCGDFADIEALIEGEPISHTVSVVIEDEMLQFAKEPGAAKLDVEVDWIEMEPFVIDRTRAEFEKQKLPIAKLDFVEFPVWVQGELRWSWYDWLDAIDGEVSWVGSIVDGLMNKDDGFMLMDGSLFYFRNLSVHPAFQGQRIGLRLLAHAMWACHRAAGDTAVLLVAPINNWFAPDEPTREPPTKEECVSLASYYARLGFRRVRTKQRDDLRFDAIPMYLHFGEQRINAYGLGGMGLPDPQTEER